MTKQLLELEGKWEEILTHASELAGHRVRVTVIPNSEPIPSPEESFRQAWQEIKIGKARPVSELWDGIDAE